MTAQTRLKLPDRMLIDHFAEFSFAPASRLGDLLEQDEFGYSDALSKLIQTIALGYTLGASDPRSDHPDRREKIGFSVQLKDALREAGRVEYLNFFPLEDKELRISLAYQELVDNWPSIRSQLDDLETDVSKGFLSFLGREFHYYFLEKNPNIRYHYIERPLALPLPEEKFQPHAMDKMRELANQNAANVSDEEIEDWMVRCATTHYRIFFEYHLFLNAERPVDYMPAGTRSSLRLSSEDIGSQVTELVVPYVALHALEKVKKRCDIVPIVAEWADTHGAEIGRGIADLLEDVRSARDDQRRKNILEAAEKHLSAEFSQTTLVLSRTLSFLSSLKSLNVNLENMTEIHRLAKSPAHKWMWTIRAPNVKDAWRERVRRLAALPQ